MYIPWWHTSAPRCKINDVNMQHFYVNMRIIYDSMQDNSFDMQNDLIRMLA